MLGSEESSRSGWCLFGKHVDKLLKLLRLLLLFPKRVLLLSSLYIGIPRVILFEKGFSWGEKKRSLELTLTYFVSEKWLQTEASCKGHEWKKPSCIENPTNQDSKPISLLCCTQVTCHSVGSQHGVLQEAVICVLKHFLPPQLNPMGLYYGPVVYFIKYIKLQSNLVHMSVFLPLAHFPKL